PLSPENFLRVLDEASDIEVLLVGTCTDLRRLPEELKLALKSRVISWFVAIFASVIVRQQSTPRRRHVAQRA
ncbi:hypothetical protein ACC764_39530, partial [Rhizobium ruizarguesonis]